MVDMNHNQTALFNMVAGKKIVIRGKRLADAWNDYTWQTDPELARLDATLPLTIDFPKFLLDYTDGLRRYHFVNCAFAIETWDSKHIGNCGYYGADDSKGEAELGIMIGNRDYWDKGYGADAVTTLVSYIFRQTDFSRVHLKTLDWNTRAQKCFQKCGFTSCGHSVRDGFSFMLMEIYRNQWQKRQVET